MNKSGKTIKELNSLLDKWQTRLLLDGWDLSIKIVEFNRTDYQQSGDIKVNLEHKKAAVLLTSKPFKDEEYVLVHELVHLLLWDLDTYSEKFVLSKSEEKLKGAHGKYMEKLEATVDHLTKILLKSKKGIN